MPIRYSLQKPEGRLGTLIIAPGRTEFIEKYREFCWDLRHEKFGICLFDHCGQGQSGRLLDDRQKGHIACFETYVADLKTLIDNHVRNHCSGPVVLMGYSMGGPVGIMIAADYPELINGLILASPMLQINTGRLFPPVIVEMVSRLMCLIGKAESYVWGGGPADPDFEYEDNVLTSDEKRYQYNVELMNNIPGVKLGSPTFGWMQQAYGFMRKARTSGCEIVCPTVILQGGDETLVSGREMELFYRTVAGCELKSYPGARHELMMEKNEIRNTVIADIKKFINKIGGDR